MAHADPDTGLALERDGPVLRLAGILDRAAATAAWPRLQAQLAGAQVLDLAGVRSVDSAGLALLAEVAARLAAAGNPFRVAGSPPGLAELCSAYRMDAALDWAEHTP